MSFNFSFEVFNMYCMNMDNFEQQELFKTEKFISDLVEEKTKKKSSFNIVFISSLLTSIIVLSFLFFFGVFDENELDTSCFSLLDAISIASFEPSIPETLNPSFFKNHRLAPVPHPISRTESSVFPIFIKFLKIVIYRALKKVQI